METHDIVDGDDGNVKRPDGRTGGGSIRPLACEVSVLRRPDGSAKLTCGSTQILAAVYGPASPRSVAKEHPARAVATVIFRYGGCRGTNTERGCSMSEREVEEFVGEGLSARVSSETWPACVVEVVLRVVRADGGVLATAFNAAVLALVDAGVPMRSLPIATTCLVVATTRRAPTDDDDDDATPPPTKTVVRLDPVAEEETSGDSSLVVLVLDSVALDQGIISSVTEGSVSLDSYMSCVSAAARASQAVLTFMRLVIEQKCTRESQTLWSN